MTKDYRLSDTPDVLAVGGELRDALSVQVAADGRATIPSHRLLRDHVGNSKTVGTVNLKQAKSRIIILSDES